MSAVHSNNTSSVHRSSEGVTTPSTPSSIRRSLNSSDNMSTSSTTTTQSLNGSTDTSHHPQIHQPSSPFVLRSTIVSRKSRANDSGSFDNCSFTSSTTPNSHPIDGKTCESDGGTKEEQSTCFSPEISSFEAVQTGGLHCGASTSMPFWCLPASKAKRVRFFRNGDQYFKGIWHAISAERLRSFQVLLCDLTRTMTDAINLPHGVRYIFSIDGSQKVTDIDEFVDGESYVCASSEVYKRVDYENAREPTWCNSLNASTASVPLLMDSPIKLEPNDFVYPRIITIIRSGVKPRRIVRHLLNKRTARSYVQVVQDLTTVVKLNSGAVRRIFAISGKEVTCLADFFCEDDVFIAYGKERMSVDDFYVVSEEMKRLYSSRHPRIRRLTDRRRMPCRNESLREGRAPSVLPNSETSRDLPLVLDNMFHIVRLIGDGNTALVYEVMCKINRNRLALKIISRENAIDKEDLIKSEVSVMRRLSHECIVQMFNFWEFDGSFFFSLELITGGDLFEYLSHVRRVKEHTAASLLKCLAMALDYLHTINIVHRDVKPENLLIHTCLNTGNLLLKLADFGLAVEMTDDLLYVICGTPSYVAPEVLAEIGYDNRVDLWAAGVILYILLCGFPPFESTDGNQEQLFEQILFGKFSFPGPVWNDVSYSAKGLILGLLHIDVDERYSAAQVLDCQWIQNYGKVSDEYEKLMEIVVKVATRNEMRSNMLQESEFEYFFSRRTSMDELSECHDVSRCNSSLEFYSPPS